MNTNTNAANGKADGNDSVTEGQKPKCMCADLRLKQYRGNLDENVRPIIQLVMDYLVETPGSLSVTECLAIAMNNWDMANQKCDA